jgi:hypothetical protein
VAAPDAPQIVAEQVIAWAAFGRLALTLRRRRRKS